MKRFHVHVAVDDLAASIDFYSKLFGQSPSKQQDYAKWILEDPRLNFAISSRGHATGVNHFGMQADSPEELTSLKALADAASNSATLDQGETACCYAKSEKHWTIDPQGLAWEHFFTMSDAETFGEDTATQTGACCIPLHSSDTDTAASDERGPCCVPQEAAQGQEKCCG
jgi:catechol 2,3-dioxygenase-like lactoylglutathione lyase family enzyme